MLWDFQKGEALLESISHDEFWTQPSQLVMMARALFFYWKLSRPHLSIITCLDPTFILLSLNWHKYIQEKFLYSVMRDLCSDLDSFSTQDQGIIISTLSCGHVAHYWLWCLCKFTYIQLTLVIGYFPYQLSGFDWMVSKLGSATRQRKDNIKYCRVLTISILANHLIAYSALKTLCGRFCEHSIFQNIFLGLLKKIKNH